jgi:ubiquinol-cytochrome c reductase cytochrome b/c1 subunit
MRLIRTNFLLDMLNKAGGSYPAPSNLSYLWNFGIYALICLVVQIVSGIILAMHYTPEIDLAFISVEHIMRDVNYGWLMRYVHANGASMFFIVVYLHSFRGLYYSSFTHPRQFLWIVGVAILLLMIITAFLGYVLPWGQMSFWGATVITNLLTAIPVVGKDIVIWLWGGFSINNATLNRFFSLHYLLPFVIVALVGLHLALLHEVGSNNPSGTPADHDKSSFTPYYTIKDLYGVILFLVFFSFFIFFGPNKLGHPDNYLPASPLVTPPHIVPEWYFLPYYAILRSIPDKMLGVFAMLISILVLFIVPILLKPEIRSMQYRPLSRYLFWIFVVNCLLLGYIGGKPVQSPYLEVGQIATAFYFAYFFIIYPFIIFLEKWFWSNRYYMHSIYSYYAYRYPTPVKNSKYK